MAEVKWIKVSTDMFESNRKIKQIEVMPEGDTILVIWLKLLLLAGNVNDGGDIYLTPEIPYTDEMLANELRRPITTVRLALTTFEKFGMIEIIDDILHLSSWEKYQSTDKLAEIREQTRKRVAKCREKKMLSQGSVTSNVTVTQGNAIEVDVDKEKEKNIDISTTTTTGEAPSGTEVYKYFKEWLDENAAKEADKFYAYNAKRGWDCMPNWKSAADLWIARIGEDRRTK